MRHAFVHVRKEGYCIFSVDTQRRTFYADSPNVAFMYLRDDMLKLTQTSIQRIKKETTGKCRIIYFDSIEQFKEDYPEEFI